MNDAVGSLHVGDGDGSGSDEHIAASADAELDFVTVGGGRHHAVLDVAGADFTRYNVMEKDGGQRLVFFGRVKIIQVDAGIGEGLIGGSKHRERAGLLKRGDQVSVGQCGDQRIVNARSSGVGGNVLRSVCRCIERKGGSGQQGYNKKCQRLVHVVVVFPFEI